MVTTRTRIMLSKLRKVEQIEPSKAEEKRGGRPVKTLIAKPSNNLYLRMEGFKISNFFVRLCVYSKQIIFLRLFICPKVIKVLLLTRVP